MMIPIAKAGVVNRNKRIYPEHVLKNCIPNTNTILVYHNAQDHTSPQLADAILRVDGTIFAEGILYVNVVPIHSNTISNEIIQLLKDDQLSVVLCGVGTGNRDETGAFVIQDDYKLEHLYLVNKKDSPWNL